MVRLEDVNDLGAYLRSRVKSLMGSEVRELALRYGYREYMIARYLDMLNTIDEVKDLLKAFEKPLNNVIRCNTLKISNCEYLTSRLSRLGFKLSKLPWERTSYMVVREGRVSLGATHEFLIGLYYLYRGPASLLPPLVLGPSHNDVVLDLAAAPGGKTTHMAQLMDNRGVIVAIDISRIRVRALRSNIERLGVRNTIILRMDGARIDKLFRNYFSKALLDAPCSAEGLIQIDKSRKTKTSLEDLIRFHNLQVRLLNAALNSVRRGGYVLYTTCSIAPEEDELVISEVLARRDDVKVTAIPKVINFSEGLTEYLGISLQNELRMCVRTYPHRHGMEGFFLCLLRRL